jgi:hypothetical protein
MDGWEAKAIVFVKDTGRDDDGVCAFSGRWRMANANAKKQKPMDLLN